MLYLEPKNMGWNTVAFLLNDLMHDLEKSPHGATYLLTHPPMSKDERFIADHAQQVAQEHGEPRIHSQALEVLPTWHADQMKFFIAGRNCIEELQWVRHGKLKDGRRTVTLALPDWYK